MKCDKNKMEIIRKKITNESAEEIVAHTVSDLSKAENKDIINFLYDMFHPKDSYDICSAKIRDKSDTIIDLLNIYFVTVSYYSLPKYVPIVNEIKNFPSEFALIDKEAFGAVRDQGTLGTCWAFSACESFHHTDETIFSPLHIAYKCKGGNLFAGGNYTDVMAYLNNWQGPVTEKDFPYEKAANIAKEVFESKKKEITEFLYDYFSKKLGNKKKLISDIISKSKYKLYYFLDTEEYNKFINPETETGTDKDTDLYYDIVNEIDKEIDNIIYPEITQKIKEYYRKFRPKPFGICENAYYLTYDHKVEKDNLPVKECLTNYEINYIKKTVSEGCAVSVSVKAPDKQDKILCNDKTEPTTHSVAVVGWNDEYISDGDEKFDKPGAFLIKNSWGTDAHKDGYFWLSYYDRTLSHAVAYDFPEKDVSYKKQLNHCPVCALEDIDGFEARYGKAVFEPKENGSVKAVRSYFFVGNTDCEFKISVNGSVKATVKEHIDFPGYRTFYLENEFSFSAGDTVEIIADYNTGNIQNGNKLPLALGRAKKGQCYYSADGKTFDDLADKGAVLGIALLY